MFFALEGPESSGKSTVITKMAELLGNDFDVLVVQEPGGTWCGRKIRTMCMEKEWFDCDPYSQATLIYGARREQWIQNIAPHLKKGGLVLADRWQISTYVYQSSLVKQQFEELQGLEKSVLPEKAVTPVHTFVLSTGFTVLEKRYKDKSKDVSPYNYASTEKRKEIISAFNGFAKSIKDASLIDASMSLAEVSNTLIQKIYRILE